MKRREMKILVAIIVVILLLLINIEIRPYEVHHSTIFTTSNTIEIKLCVIANSLLPIDDEEMVKTIVEHHVKINGSREGAVYELEIYRTNIHYRQNWKYNTFFCDEKGNIIEIPAIM